MEKTGGFCIPDFTVLGRRVYFALDDIDYIEDTPFGQNSTHGTVMVMWQEASNHDGAELINPKLEMPDTSSPVEIDVEYLKAPEVNPKAIRFHNLCFEDSQSKQFLHEYSEVFRT